MRQSMILSTILVLAITLIIGCQKQASNSAPPESNQETAATIPDWEPLPAAAATTEYFEPAIDGQVAEYSSPASQHQVQAQTFEPPAQAWDLQAAPLEYAQQPAGGTQRASLLSQFPAGAKLGEQGFATVQVFYATDRARGPLQVSDYEITGQKQLFVSLAAAASLLFLFGAFTWFLGRTRIGLLSGMLGCVIGVLAGASITLGQANIEKHGVTYFGDRGSLVRGVCEVTVPDTHQRGIVERPSLLRFEFKEDQQQHIVLTSAVELSETDFHSRLAKMVGQSVDGDLLLFIHGYNVDFESAIQRTAQIAVDLPFQGVPVCYSWPSQGTLVGYSIDETNADWTTAHLTQFLKELVKETGARSINVVAHSMGNRPMTAAMEQIRWQREEELGTPFDRIVLAAPDIDADRFRRDLAPTLLQVADQVTLYASSDDQALIASKQVHGYPRAGESGVNVVVVPGVETVDVSGIDLSLLGHSYYGDNESMLQDLYEVVRARLPAPRRALLIPQQQGELMYWQLAQRRPVVR
jgi:esterase/lipase superfamily enzyme